jgi:hypothetical protein
MPQGRTGNRFLFFAKKKFNPLGGTLRFPLRPTAGVTRSAHGQIEGVPPGGSKEAARAASYRASLGCYRSRGYHHAGDL